MRRWSKLKSRVEAFFAPSVAGRVELRIAGYRWDRDREGRGWITVDGVEVHNFCTFTQWRESAALQPDLVELSALPQAGSGASDHAGLPVGDLLESRGVLSQQQFTQALVSYCNLSLEQALESELFVHRALAVLDGRLGKRRLASLRLSSAEHPLVARLLAFRLSAERKVGFPEIAKQP